MQNTQQQKFRCYSLIRFKTLLHSKDLQLVRLRNMNNFFEVRPVAVDEDLASTKSYAIVQRFQSWSTNEEADDICDSNTNDEVCAENIDLLLSELAAYRDAQDAIKRIEQEKTWNEMKNQADNDKKWHAILEEKDKEIAQLKQELLLLKQEQPLHKIDFDETGKTMLA